MRKGPGVDVVCSVYDYHPIEKADTVLCLETMEHVEFTRSAVDNMKSMLKPEGVFVMTTHQNFDTHSHPSDYWRFTEYGIEHLVRYFDTKIIFKGGADLNPHTVGCVAWPTNGISNETFNRAMNCVREAGMSGRVA